MPSESVCRLCLATDIPMHVIAHSSLQDVYENLTNVSLTSLNKPVVACYLCYSQLRKCHKLMSRSVRADQLLTQILECGLTVNPETVHMLDRKAYKLVDSLSITPLEIVEFIIPGYHIDKQIKEEPMTQTDKIESETDWINVENIKHEKPCVDFAVQNLGGSFDIVNEGLVYNEDVTCGIDGYLIQDSVNVEDVKNEELLMMAGMETDDDLTKKFQPHSKTETTLIPSNSQEKLTESNEEPRTNRKRKTRKRYRKKKPETYIDNYINTENYIDNDTCKDGKFICEYCNIVYDNKSLLTQHIEQHNIGDKPFQCTTCNHEYRSKSKMLKHTKIHLKRFECTTCNKKFGLKCNLDRHIRIHTKEKRFQCTICGLYYFTQTHLDQHLIIHTGEKPFKCEICKLRFNRKSNLTTHMNEHSGEKLFNCNICQKRFKRKGNLNEHLRVHTGEKPYKCNVCSSLYSHKHSLKKHMQTHDKFAEVCL